MGSMSAPPPSQIWQLGRFQLPIMQPCVMGIVNVTPDSFSDGARLAGVHEAMARCEALMEQGADVLDLGGESSRPGAQPVPLEEELLRVLPVVREAVKLGVPISVDTCKPTVMRAVLDAGADCINDIWALRLADASGTALEAVAAHPSCGVVLMHMHGEPQTMQVRPMAAEPGEGFVDEVLFFLEQRIEEFRRHLAHLSPNLPISGSGGTQSASSRLCIDPGIGFGKTVAQNFCLLSHQARLCGLGVPVMAGWSRKSSLGAVTGLEVGERMLPSVAAAVLAAERGARVLRVHDVRETVAALAVWRAAN
jgi:dihydropteroate synthase